MPFPETARDCGGTSTRCDGVGSSRSSDAASVHTCTLAEAVAEVKPTILIGVSTVGGLFTETVIRNMAKKVDRPIIFPLSNPTDKAECTPEQAYEWTDGKALVAAGVQFPNVMIDGKTFHPGQANNFYIF